jgi:glycosyltransferase involved in cell wall biosynthesis
MRIPKLRRFDPGWESRLRLMGRTLRAADAVLCNAPHLKADVQQQFRLDPKRVHVIYNGIDLPPWTANAAVRPSAGVVVANFHPYKGHDVLLNALRLLPDPPVVRLCGVGQTRSVVQAAARDLATVEFVDPPADIPAELRRAQFAVHPSRTEGLSNAILEEMAAGLAVIACDVGGNPILIEDGVTGLLVPPGNAQALAEAIARIIADDETRVAMGRRGRERASRLSWDACVRAHIDLYSDILATRSH